MGREKAPVPVDVTMHDLQIVCLSSALALGGTELCRGWF